MPADLRSINNFADLIAHLRDELDWPVEDYLLDQLTFEYDADELGLKDEEAEKLKDGTIRQLRPLPGGQPFGIFFVEFGQSKLPVVVLRRILNALVIKKRNSANPADRQRWDAADILFISAFGLTPSSPSTNPKASNSTPSSSPASASPSAPSATPRFSSSNPQNPIVPAPRPLCDLRAFAVQILPLSTFDVGRSMFDVLSLFPIKNPKSSIENRQSTPLPMGFTLTSPADQSVRRPRQCLLFGTDDEFEFQRRGLASGKQEGSDFTCMMWPWDIAINSHQCDL